MTTGISRRLVAGSWQTPAADTTAAAKTLSAPPAPGDEAPATPASTAAVTDLVLTDTSADIHAAAAPASGARAAASDGTVTAVEAAGTAYCSFITTATPQRSTDVVEFHNAANSNGSWSYGKSADSDVEGGIDYSGNGGWSVGATRHVSNSTSSTVSRSYSGGDKANNYGSTDFKFIDGYYKPYGAGTTCAGTSIPVNTKVKNPAKWVAGVGANTAAGLRDPDLAPDVVPGWRLVQPVVQLGGTDRRRG